MEDSMRQPVTGPTTLRAVVNVLSDERLRTLVIQLAVELTTHDDATAGAPELVLTAPRARRAYRRRAGSRPPGRRRGPGRPRKDPDLATEAKLAARRQRNNAAARARRAAARAQRTGASNGSGTGGNGSPETTPAQQLWQHAARLLPKRPWHAVATEFDLNDAMVLDAYRSKTLPPGLTPAAIERFLETSPA
jgi:hypothetical protein